MPFSLGNTIDLARDALNPLEHARGEHLAHDQRRRREVVAGNVSGEGHLERRQQRAVAAHQGKDGLQLARRIVNARPEDDAQRAAPPVLDQHRLARADLGQLRRHKVAEGLAATWSGRVHGDLNDALQARSRDGAALSMICPFASSQP